MIKIGDVYSIRVASGCAYFQYTKKISPMGALIRVLPGAYMDTPDIETLIECDTNFWIFFPVSAALKKNVIMRVGNYYIPEHSRQPPVFRTGVVDPGTGKVETWWFWNGEKEWKIGQITEAQKKMPIRGAWNDTLLIQRINEGWLPENDRR